MGNDQRFLDDQSAQLEAAITAQEAQRAVLGDAVGDLICKVAIETPVNLGKRQKEILRDFEDALQGGGSRHNPRASSWLDSVKGFFEDFKT